MKKKAQVHLLPTDKASKIVLVNPTALQLSSLIYSEQLEGFIKQGSKYQHLYFTSDEKIKEGDHFIINSGKGKNGGGIIGKHYNGQKLDKDDRKIVTTTDPDLCIEKREMVGSNSRYTKWAFPRIGDDFIQVYIKAYNEGNPITEVMLEYELLDYAEEMKTTSLTNEILKLRSNGTVIISPVKEKMYSRNEMIQAAQDYALDCLKAAVVDKYNSVPYYVEWFNKHYPE